MHRFEENNTFFDYVHLYDFCKSLNDHNLKIIHLSFFRHLRFQNIVFTDHKIEVIKSLFSITVYGQFFFLI